MNLRRLNNNVPGAAASARVAAGFFRQIRRRGLMSTHFTMSLPVRTRLVVVCLAGVLLAVTASTAMAQTNYYSAYGSQYAVVGPLPGDQVFPDAAVTPNGGFVVWQDNATDGDGWGISARRLDGTLSGTLGTFRVNAEGTNDQERARVALLKNGGAAFVWQGGVEGYQHIYARFLNAGNTFLTTTDLAVSAFDSPSSFQVNPAVAVLNNSNVVVVWSSYDQAGPNSLLDVYAKILSPVGATVKSEFLVNQFISYNQRTPAVAALKGGGFVVTWISEQERLLAPVLGTNSTYSSASSVSLPSVDIYARLFQSDGTAVGNEFIVNEGSNPCANPAVAAASDGSFMVAWSRRDIVTYVNGWDVYARTFLADGTVENSQFLVNTHVLGNQYAPRLSSIGTDYLAVWTSLNQDGSREGVYGQFVRADGTRTGGEFRVNTSTAGQQMQPVVASDGVSQFLAVWTTYTGNPYSFDLNAQRYVNNNAVLQPMTAPFVYAPFTLSNNIYQPQLQVSWAPLQGISVSNYEVYVDGNATPVGVTTSNVWTMTAANGLTTNSTHTFQVDYVRTDGARSPLSPATSGTTWSGLNWGGIPYEWMAAYYGGYVNGVFHTNNWPAAGTVLGTGDTTLYDIYLMSGGDLNWTVNPFDSTTWLQQTLTPTSQGLFLSWNTQPGATYQVETRTNFTSPWSNLGSPRFAAGTTDSIYVGGGNGGYYRIMLLR